MEQVHPNAFAADCPTREILSRLAEKWTMLTLAALSEKRMRFGDLHRQIEGVSQKMLTKTLRKLEEDGLVHREVFDEMPLRVEYELTDLGQDIARLVVELKGWLEGSLERIQAASNQHR